MKPLLARFARIATALIGIACVQFASAQSFPSKPMQIIVPFSAGGVVDLLARVLAAQVAESIGQQVIVIDRPGASSILGMDICAKAAPDGHTVCITVPDSLSYLPHLFAKLPYDPEKDFAPVTNLAFTNNLLVASARSLSDLEFFRKAACCSAHLKAVKTFWEI